MPSRGTNPVKVTRADGSTATIGTNRIPRALELAVYQRDGFKCRYCGWEGPASGFEIDHVIPRSKGGADEMLNLAVACWPCNHHKKAETWILDGRPLRFQPGFNRAAWRSLVRRAAARRRGEAVRPRKVTVSRRG